MKKNKITNKKINKIYSKLYEAYYLHSILNKILLGNSNFEVLEISTLSEICNRTLHITRKKLLNLTQ